MIDKFKKINSILDKPTRYKLSGILILLGFGALLELVGIGAFIPLLQILVDPAAAASNPVTAALRSLLPEMSDKDWIIASCLMIVGVMMVRNLALLGIVFVQNRMLYRMQADYAERLFAFYMNQPFLFHIGSNSADLIRNVHSSIQRVFSGALLPALNLTLEVLLGLAACAVLFLIEPVATALLFGLLGAGGGVIYLLIRGYARDWGAESHHIEALILRALSQGLHATSEAKVLGRERFFSSVFGQRARARARVDSAHATMTQTPRLALEILAAVGLAAVVIFIVAVTGQTASLIPTLGVYTIAAFRVMPSLNRALGHAAIIRATAAAIDTVHADLSRMPEALHINAGAADAPPLPFRDALTLNGVSFSYPGRDAVAVRDVNMTIPRGASVALVGPSGSGKSTLAALLLGLIKPDAGTIVVDSTDIAADPRGWQKQIGYVPQAVFIADESLRNNIAFGLPDGEIDESRVRHAVNLANLSAVVAALPNGLDTVIGERGSRLSGGQRQRLGIARALYRDPAVLVMDEATSALDSETEWQIGNSIQSLHGGKTIILIAHRLSTIKHCDTVFFMKDGEVADSGPFDVLASRNADFKRLIDLARLDGDGRLDGDEKQRKD